MAFSGDGKTLATGNLDSTINVWSLATGGKKRNTLTGHFIVCQFGFAFSGDGGNVWPVVVRTRGGKGDKAIKFVGRWRPVTSCGPLVGPPFDSVESVAFSPDGKMFSHWQF
jgi:hypothetical protein